MTIAVALSFDSGVLLCADTQQGLPARIPCPSSRIFQRSYRSHPSGARSVFLISEPVDAVVAARERFERALDDLPSGEYTLERMRFAIEQALLEDRSRDWTPQLDDLETIAAHALAWERRLLRERQSEPLAAACA